MLTTIEDLILHIYDPMNGFDRKALPARDRSILFSMASQLKKPLALTEKQATLAVKIINENKHLYERIDNLQRLLEYPLHKYPFRAIDSVRKIFLLNNNSIAVKFPFDNGLNKLLDKIPGRKQYNVEHRCHVYKLNEDNLYLIVKTFKNYNFVIDVLLEQWYSQIVEIKENPTSYVPSVEVNTSVELLNCSTCIQEHFDKNKTGVLAEDLFLAKSMKLFFTEKVHDIIQTLEVSDITKKYLSKDNHAISVSKHCKNDIAMMLQDLKAYPILMLTEDDDNEFISWIASFIQYGIKTSEMSVLFRSDKNVSFNEYIKTQQLNNLVDENTKIVFIKNKMPKILYKLDFTPKVVISNNTFYVHYTSQKVVDSHPAVLYYSDKQSIGKKIAEL